MKAEISRRGLFALFTRALVPQPGPPDGVQARDLIAVVQGRHCLALTSFCSVCVERCPVPGAMHVAKGMPMVVPDACTGCGVCHDVCPAPVNAVLMLPRPPYLNRNNPAKAHV